MTTDSSARLIKLLRAAYAASPEELRSLTVRVYGKEVAAALTGDSADALATSLVEEIERRNLDWPVLLADLRDNTPLVADEVDEFARQLGINVPGESAGRPDMPLSDAWFRARLAEATQQLDRRYILGLLGQDAHVHVPIEQMLDAVVRGPGLQRRWEELLDDLSAQAKYGYDLDAAMDPARAKALPGELQNLAFEAGALRLSGTAPLDLGAMSLRVEELACELEAMWMHTFRLETADKGGEASETLSVATQHPREHSERVGGARRWLQRALSALKELREFLQGPEVQAAIAGVLAVTGPAGSGKSHLFAHEATQWLDTGRPVVLILGEHFHGAGPAAAEILRILGEPGRIFWDDLERLSSSRGCKAVVMLDALNETEGSTFWKHNLQVLLAFMRSRPNIAFVFSVRTEYIQDALPRDFLKSLPTAEHRGFRDISADQLNGVFRAYGLDGPRAIPVQEELLNPLMLHLVCRSLQDKKAPGLDDLPEGAIALWRLVVDDLNERLAAPERLNFDHQADVVGEALRVIGLELWRADEVALPRTVLCGPVQEVIVAHCYTPPPADLLRELKREGFLAEQFGHSNRKGQMLRFQFQRLGETFQAEAILEKLGAGADPRKAFLTFLDSIGTRHVRRWQYKGVLQMMSLHLGETHKLEAVDIARGHAMEGVVGVQWRLSLPLRSTASVGADCVRCFKEWIRSRRAKADELYGLLLQLALRPDHPLNADYLHKSLLGQKMASRDIGWSEFVFYSDGDAHGLTNIRTWIDIAANAHTLDSEVARLAAIVLAWSFTTSQRFVRDRNTKSLVRLLSAAPDLAAPLVRQFAQVNDQYVVERVVAAAYGAATRVNDPGAVEALCLAVWECFFEAGTPPQHILLRDYARSIVELASHRGLLPPSVDFVKTRPPYVVVSFDEDLPDEESLERRLARPNGQYGPSSAILSSMDERGDFWRYVTGANYGFDPEWSCRPRSGGPSLRERWRLEFEDSLTPEQLSIWQELYGHAFVSGGEKELGTADVTETPKISGGELTSRMLEAESMLGVREEGKFVVRPDEQWFMDYFALSEEAHKVKETRRKEFKVALESTLSDQQRMLYRRVEHGSYHRGHPPNLDLFPAGLARRWMIQRILDLGWSEARLGALDDSRIGYSYRSAHKAERLGKKYQWLAWHGLLAALQDAFEPRKSGEWASVIPHGFPTRQRDIDPTCLTSQTEGREHLNGVDRCWWCPIDYTKTIAIDPAAVWKRSATDIPKLQSLLEVSDPEGRRWLVLNIYREWEQDMPVGRRGLEALARHYHVLVRSAVVRADEVYTIGTWLGGQSMMGGWFPKEESPDARLRECWWHPANHHLRHEDDETWRSIDHAPYPWRLMPSEVTLLYEDATFDCSIESTFDIQLPTPWLVAKLGLTHGPADGTWVDAEGEVLFMDPSLQHPGPSALLMRRDVLERLAVLGYTLVWTGLGELLGEEGGERQYVSATSAAFWLENGTWRGKQWQHPWSEREVDGEE